MIFKFDYKFSKFYCIFCFIISFNILGGHKNIFFFSELIRQSYNSLRDSEGINVWSLNLNINF